MTKLRNFAWKSNELIKNCGHPNSVRDSHLFPFGNKSWKVLFLYNVPSVSGLLCAAK